MTQFESPTIIMNDEDGRSPAKYKGNLIGLIGLDDTVDSGTHNNCTELNPVGSTTVFKVPCSFIVIVPAIFQYHQETLFSLKSEKHRS